MADTPLNPSASVDRLAIAQANPSIVSGAHWFWWIAALSLVNTVMIHSGSDTSFAIGLGFTLIADSLFREVKLLAFGIDAIALGAIFALGWFGGRGHLWALVLGIALYTLDALIYVYFQEWMSVAFHGLALFYLFRAAKQLKDALREAAAAAKVTLAPPPVAPGLN
jgi:hypothetical protein